MTDETEAPDRWLGEIPFGLKMSALISVIFGIGIFFLTTIGSSFRVSLYSGIGAGCIVMTITFTVWLIQRHASKKNWQF